MSPLAATHDLPRFSESDAPVGTTLLALVQELTDAGCDEDGVVDRALALLESGRARLTGNFRNVPVEVFRLS